MNQLTRILGYGLFLLLLFAGPAPLLAQVDLYAGEVPVTSEAADERNRAIAAALRQVLVKLTGSRAIAGRRGLDQIMAAAPDLVQQYRYRVDQQAAGEAPPRTLWVRFEPTALIGLLHEQGWPVWQPPRPRLLVWLVTEKAGTRSLLNPDVTPDVAQGLLNRADERGMRLQWPLLDLEDQARLTASDLWSGFESSIREASQRYGDGPVLVGRLRSSSGGSWRAEWTLYDRSGASELKGSKAPLAQVMGEGVDWAADLLAGRYAPALGSSGSTPVRVDIRGINTLDDYAKALRLVAQAPGVARLSLREAADDLVSFDVWVDGDAHDLSTGLGIDGRLRPAVGVVSESQQDRLVFYWVP